MENSEIVERVMKELQDIDNRLTPTPERIERQRRDLQNRARKKQAKRIAGLFWKKALTNPALLVLNVVSKVTKIIGCISGIGIPFGLYFAYKTVLFLIHKVPLAEIAQATYMLYFLALPMLAFTIHAIADTLYDYFNIKLLKYIKTTNDTIRLNDNSYR